MRICIIQSNYIPWKGFFDLIGRCDEYVIFDRVQYARRHWHNRNRIKTANGVEWLTISVVSKAVSSSRSTRSRSKEREPENIGPRSIGARSNLPTGGPPSSRRSRPM